MTFTTGAWPVMLTPFTEGDRVDAPALDRYTDWLIGEGAVGLFPVALSGEMYELSREERLAIATRVVARASGRVPVAAAALGDGTHAGLASEVSDLAAAGVDVVVLVVPALLGPDDVRLRGGSQGPSEDEWMLLERGCPRAVPDVALGIYECPLPHHRILSIETVEHLARTGRFAFFKETSHDVEVMRDRVRVGAPHGLAILNAGIENYAESLAVGVSGLSGWVANVAPAEVARLTALVIEGGVTAEALSLQGALVGVEQAMGGTYPSSAKAIVNERSGAGFTLRSRWRPADVDPGRVASLVADLAAAR